MPLELRKDRNGKIRNHWYGRYEANGKRYCVNLGVEVRGKIPTSLKQFGDIAFERSRAEAQYFWEIFCKRSPQPTQNFYSFCNSVAKN